MIGAVAPLPGSWISLGLEEDSKRKAPQRALSPTWHQTTPELLRSGDLKWGMWSKKGQHRRALAPRPSGTHRVLANRMDSEQRLRDKLRLDPGTRTKAQG